MSETVEINDATAEFLDELIKEKESINNRKEAVQHCVEQTAKFYA